MAVSEAEVGVGRTRSRPAWRERTASAAPVLRRILAEPLTHFVIAGFILFVAGSFYEQANSTYRIVVTPRHVAQLANDYALQFGTQPDAKTLESLVQRDVHDEMLVRQGMALKLGDDDEIVRRRISQKMQFLIQDLNPPAEPTDAQLQAYFTAHSAHYVTQPRATFTHIYFSSDAVGDAVAEARAEAVLHNLPNSVARAPERGDVFPDLYDFSAYEPVQVERLFGKTPLAQAVFSAPVGHWTGPFKSGYGWHLVYVSARQAPALPPLSAVRDTVRTDYLQDAEDGANKAAFDKLAGHFTVVRDDLKPGA